MSRKIKKRINKLGKMKKIMESKIEKLKKRLKINKLD